MSELQHEVQVLPCCNSRPSDKLLLTPLMHAEWDKHANSVHSMTNIAQDLHLDLVNWVANNLDEVFA